jgi:hypothetical protein
MLVEIKADTSAITSVKNDTTELRKLFVSKMKIDVDEKVFSWLSAPKRTIMKPSKRSDSQILGYGSSMARLSQAGKPASKSLCGCTVSRDVGRLFSGESSVYSLQKASILPADFLSTSRRMKFAWQGCGQNLLESSLYVSGVLPAESSTRYRKSCLVTRWLR